jgi:hypothetical protein
MDLGHCWLKLAQLLEGFLGIGITSGGKRALAFFCVMLDRIGGLGMRSG